MRTKTLIEEKLERLRREQRPERPVLRLPLHRPPPRPPGRDRLREYPSERGVTVIDFNLEL